MRITLPTARGFNYTTPVAFLFLVLAVHVDAYVLGNKTDGQDALTHARDVKHAPKLHMKLAWYLIDAVLSVVLVWLGGMFAGLTLA